MIAEYNEKIIGVCCLLSIFSSLGKAVHLEDVLLNEKYRHCGLGRKFFSKIEEFVKEDGYSKMEWSCLDWNTPSIRFYDKIGATQEQGRVYFSYNCKQI